MLWRRSRVGAVKVQSTATGAQRTLTGTQRDCKQTQREHIRSVVKRRSTTRIRSNFLGFLSLTFFAGAGSSPRNATQEGGRSNFSRRGHLLPGPGVEIITPPNRIAPPGTPATGTGVLVFFDV